MQQDHLSDEYIIKSLVYKYLNAYILSIYITLHRSYVTRLPQNLRNINPQPQETGEKHYIISNRMYMVISVHDTK